MSQSATTGAKYTVGQRVYVSDVNGPRMGEGWGEVTKVGRKLITVRYGQQERTFRIDDGSANDNWGHQHVHTEAERERSERKRAAVAVLREHRLSLDFGANISLDTLEAIAALLSSDSPR